MKTKSFLLCWLFSIAIFSIVQKRVFEYPIELKKGGSEYINGSGAHPKSCFLKDPDTENFMRLSTGIINQNTQTFEKTEIANDYASAIAGEKGKSCINSFLFRNNLYSLLINNKNIHLVVKELFLNQLLQSHELNENTNLGVFTETPLEESRNRKREKEKKIDDKKRVIKALDRGSERVLVKHDKKRKLAVTIYDANYYLSTHFKLLLDSSSFKLAERTGSYTSS